MCFPILKIKKIFILLILFFTNSNLLAFENDYIKSVYSLPISLDPIQMNDTASLVAGNLLYDGLVRFDKDLNIVPALAKSWSTSSDGKTLTFNLHENATFHDGIRVTSRDVIFSIGRALGSNSKVKKIYDCIASVTENGFNPKLAFKIINSHTFQINLKYPFPPFLSILAGATAKIIPMDKSQNDSFFKSPIGSGPFKFKKLDIQNKELLLTKFNDYYLGSAFLDQIILKETTEEEAIKLAKLGKVHDLSNWPLTSTNDVFKMGKVISTPVSSTWIIGLNTTIPPLDNVNVRRLLREHIDSEKFRKLFYPDAIRAKGYIPHGLVGSNFNLTEKKSTLIKPPKSLITLVIPEELSNAIKMKSFFEDELIKKGWNLKVNLISWNKLMDGYSNKIHQSFLVSMNMDYPDPEFLLQNFESTNSDNFSGINNHNLDQLLKESRTKQDRNEREVIYRHALQIIQDEALTVNLFHPRANYWLHQCVKNFAPNILSDVYIDYTKVIFDHECLKTVVRK